MGKFKYLQGKELSATIPSPRDNHYQYFPICASLSLSLSLPSSLQSDRPDHTYLAIFKHSMILFCIFSAFALVAYSTSINGASF